MKKFNKNDYRFIDFSKTDYNEFSELELDDMVADTKEVLSMTKGKIKSTPMNIGLVSGLLDMRGGEFIKVNIFGSKWKKGNTTKEERKLIEKVFSTAKLYYLFKVFIVLLSKGEAEQDIFNSTLAQKIK